MIDFSNLEKDSKTKLFQEGILDSALKGASDVDTGAIKDAWKDADKSIIDKAEVINKEGLTKVRQQSDAISGALKKNTVDTRSIIARARNSVLQFPIYVTKTIQYNEAHIIGKMFERVYTTLVQTVLSQNPIMDEEEANNLVFLKQFHTNIREAADVLVNRYYDPIDDIDRMMCESIFLSQQISENCKVDFRVIPCVDADLITENARLMNEPLSGFIYLKEALSEKEKSTREETSETTGKVSVMSKDDLNNVIADMDGIDKESLNLVGKSNDQIRKEVIAKIGDADASKVSDEVKELIDKRDELEEDIQSSLKTLKDDVIKMRLEPKEYAKLSKDEQKRLEKLKKTHGDISFKNGQFRRQENQTKIAYKQKSAATPVEKAIDAPHILKDSDIKKFNGLLPYTIEAMFTIRTKQGLNREVRYIIGIKTVLHPFLSQDLADDLRELVTGNIQTLQKVRYKTGEIGFKDYFFNIKGLKADASKHVNYDKRWINTLKRLGEYKNMNGSLMKKPIEAISGGNVPIPNGTIILSQPDVSTLANQTGIDLSLVSNAKRLAKSLFLIGVVIVDSLEGTMRVLFPDSDNEWDVQSLAAIDSELVKTDNSQLMRELNKMVNR